MVDSSEIRDFLASMYMNEVVDIAKCRDKPMVFSVNLCELSDFCPKNSVFLCKSPLEFTERLRECVINMQKSVVGEITPNVNFRIRYTNSPFMVY